MRKWMITLITVVLVGAPATLAAQVKIGMITTLSGGGSALGVAVRDGFKLAIDQEGGKLGGTAVEFLVEDDARKSGKALQVANRFVKRDKVDIMTGIIWSNLAIAVVPKVVEAGVFYISPNAGPSKLAGKGCHENYFNVAWQNDNLHEAMGQHVAQEGYKNAYILAPNYPAGKDALRGFKRFYKGNVAGEVYTKLGQKDYAAEIAALRGANPDAVFFFLPGGMGISFIKQYHQAGLTGKIPLFGPAFSFDQTILGAVGDAALGRDQLLPVEQGHRQPGQQAVRARLPEGLQAAAVALRQPGLRCRAFDRRRAQEHGREGVRQGRLPRGLAQGRLRVGAGKLQVRSEPPPGPGRPRPRGGARRQGPDQQDHRQGLLEPRGRIRGPVQDVAPLH